MSTSYKRCFAILTLVSVFVITCLFYMINNRKAEFRIKESLTVSLAGCFYPTRTAKTRPKKFLYLLQGESCLSEHLKGDRQIGCGSTCKCDILMLGYKSKCSKASLEHIEYIHKNGTTWSTGRNYLYQYAMKRSSKYLYYIFMDSDISLQPNSKSDDMVYKLGPWRSFEIFLLNYEPAIGSASYCSFIDTRCKSFNPPNVHKIKGFYIDAAFNALHFKVLPYLLPYQTKYESIGWWQSQFYMTLLAKYYFDGKVFTYTKINAVNILHSDYPKIGVNGNALKLMKEDVEEIVKEKNLSMLIWQGKNVTEISDGHCLC